MLSLLGTPLVGRHDELHQARTRLRGDARLVTLWGPPGIGKTRLARALCDEQRPLPVVVSLSGVDDVGGLVAAVAAALGDGPDPVEGLRRLGETWLVLDTLEHLLEGTEGEAVRQCLSRWLSEAPALTLLVTSQRRLRLSVEQAVELGPLDPDGAGRDLLIASIRHHRPDFAPDDDERRRLTRLARELDGVPLALELAAARWELLGTDGLLKRLSGGLSLLSRPRATDPRHATLRAALGWAWELLDDDDQTALKALATLRSPFDLPTAEALVGPRALDRLETLRNAALVAVPEPGRFQLFASLRRFVRERWSTDEAAELSLRHAGWCVARAPDPDTGTAAPELRDDLLAATRTLLEQGDPRAESAVVALAAAAPGQHLPLLDAAVDAFDTPPVRRARARALGRHGQMAAAEIDLQAALQAATDSRERGHVLRELGVLSHGRRDVDEARRLYTEALGSARSCGDARGEAILVGNLGALDHDVCRYEDAEERYTRALDGLRAVGDRRVEAIFLQNQAVLRQEQGLLEAAGDAYHRALTLLEEQSDGRMQAITLSNLGLLHTERGDLEAARTALQRALGRFAGVPDPGSTARCRARLAAVEALSGDAAAAARQLDAARRALAGSEDPVVARVLDLFEAFVFVARGQPEGVEARLSAAENGDEGAPLVEISADARVACRLLRGAAEVAEEALHTGEDWFQLPGGERQDLSRYATSRRMFRALVDHRRERRDGGLSVEDLFAAGWPGETIGWDSMRNRVHVNLARLRRMGLKRALVRDDDGYRLDPALPLLDEG